MGCYDANMILVGCYATATLQKTYSECKNCAFRILCSLFLASTIAYLYISFSDNGVVFFDAKLSSSSISTPTVVAEGGIVVSKDADGSMGSVIVEADAEAVVDASFGDVGSTNDERATEDETMGFFHPDAVGLLFFATSRCAA